MIITGTCERTSWEKKYAKPWQRQYLELASIVLRHEYTQVPPSTHSLDNSVSLYPYCLRAVSDNGCFTLERRALRRASHVIHDVTTRDDVSSVTYPR